MKKNQLLYLGVEGGATKSTALLVGENNKVLGKRTGGPLNYDNIGKRGVKKNLAALLKPLLKKAGKGKLCVVLGLAGLDTLHNKNAYIKIARSVLGKNVKCEVVNDAKVAMEARCPGEHNRILVIAGTGSNIFGESGKKTAKSGGVGFILSDEGSAYGNGLKAMRAAVRSWDGRSQKTVLEKLVLQKAGAKKMEDFIVDVYDMFRDRSQEMKRYIASFSPVIDAALEKRDGAAFTIRKEAVEELVVGVRAVANRLKLQHKEFCLGFMGSQWKMPGFKKAFVRQVKKQFPRVRFSEREEAGAWGAVVLAKKLSVLG